MGSTYLATPTLKLEANAVVRKLRWPFAFLPLLLCLVVVGGACFSESDRSNAPRERVEDTTPGMPALLGVDLSDAAVSAISREELWAIGVHHAAWPAEIPSGATKLDIHQRLLEVKYAHVGDFGYADDAPPDFGYVEND